MKPKDDENMKEKKQMAWICNRLENKCERDVKRTEILSRYCQNMKTQSRKSSSEENEKSAVTFTDKAPMGDSESVSTVARSSSTDAEIGAVPLFSGFISTWIFRSISSSLSLSELE